MKWSDRSRGDAFFNKRKTQIRNLILSLSGNDIVALMLDVLNQDELNQIREKHIQALKIIGEVVSNREIVKQKHKHHFIRPLRLAGFSTSQAREFGFQLTSNLWLSRLDQTER
jgi:hypothetical protein